MSTLAELAAAATAIGIVSAVFAAILGVLYLAGRRTATCATCGWTGPRRRLDVWPGGRAVCINRDACYWRYCQRRGQ